MDLGLKKYQVESMVTEILRKGLTRSEVTEREESEDSVNSDLKYNYIRIRTIT